MNHDCRALLCDTPHFDNDSHSDECLCELCHPEHDWSAWNVYPPCEGCLAMLELWIYENTDRGLGIIFEHFDPTKYEADLTRWLAHRAADESKKRGSSYEYRKSA